jgi:hypothetical protein
VEIPEDALQPKTFEVWQEHEDVVLMFLRCQTQWRSSGNGVTGLDYNVVLQLCDLYAVRDKRQLMDDLQIMEARARELINDAAAKLMKGKRAG